MPTIRIDDKEFDANQLPEEAKAQLSSIQFVDIELARLNAQIAALQTARIAYSRELKNYIDAIDKKGKGKSKLN